MAFLIPPVAFVLGVVVQGEVVAGLAVAGGALCVVGAWVMRRVRGEPTAGGVLCSAVRRRSEGGSERGHGRERRPRNGERDPRDA